MRKALNGTEPFKKELSDMAKDLPPGEYYRICTDLQASDYETGAPVLDENGGAVIERNYYCGEERHPVTHVLFNVWDTDAAYSFRFPSLHGARNFARAVLKMDGLYITRVKPLPGNHSKHAIYEETVIEKVG